MATSDADRYALIDDIAERFEQAGIPTPVVDARLLVDHITERFGSLSRCERNVLDAMIERRAAREPMQLVIGRTWFRDLEVLCRAGVFIPRPETEIVAGIAIDAARAAGPDPVVVEPCTGTGAIALSVVTEVAGARVVASDRSPEAVALAVENLERVTDLGAVAEGAWMSVHEGALLDAVPANLRGRVDVLVANPPYLPVADVGAFEPEVADHDPFDALIAGTDGLEIVEQLLDLATTWLAPGGHVVIEIDDRRGADAAAMATRAGLVDVRVERDLTQRDRALVARRSGG